MKRRETWESMWSDSLLPLLDVRGTAAVVVSAAEGGSLKTVSPGATSDLCFCHTAETWLLVEFPVGVMQFFSFCFFFFFPVRMVM